MTFGKGIASFHSMTEVKHTAQPKNLMSQSKHVRGPTELSNGLNTTVLIHRPTWLLLRVQELWLIFSKTLCCCSHKCLYGKVGAAALIDTF